MRDTLRASVAHSRKVTPAMTVRDGSPVRNRRWFFDWKERAEQAVASGDINSTCYFVLMVLPGFSNYADGSNARPGLELLMARTGLSRTTVTEALLSGQRVGLIERVSRGSGGKGTGRASVYRFLIEEQTQPESRDPHRSEPATRSEREPTSGPKSESETGSNMRTLPRQPGRSDEPNRLRTTKTKRVRRPRTVISVNSEFGEDQDSVYDRSSSIVPTEGKNFVPGHKMSREELDALTQRNSRLPEKKKHWEQKERETRQRIAEAKSEERHRKYELDEYEIDDCLDDEEDDDPDEYPLDNSED